MRITNQMLDATAKRTGIPVNQNSLLHYMNEDGETSKDTLLDALQKNHEVSGKTAAEYRKLEKAADGLKEQAQKLAGTGAESFFQKIKESGNSEELYETVQSYIGHYNATLAGLEKAPGVLNQYYREMLQETASGNSQAFAEIGITVGKGGALSLDKEIFKKAPVDTVEQVFGASGILASRTAFLAERISDNAQAGMQSVSSQYDGSGNVYSQLASQFDLFR